MIAPLKRYFSSKWIPSTGTYPAGFIVNGIETGVKKSGKDLTLVTSIVPCTTSAVFTKNSFCAAPVQLSKIISQLASKSGEGIHGIVINSGCANACTGIIWGLNDRRKGTGRRQSYGTSC
jgi:glutamate N-acetyltransferase/amino-acid N-acetyltransferase